MIKRMLKWLAYHIPLNNIIVFESCPDLTDNTKAVFDEFVNRKINDKFKLIWFCSDPIRKDYPRIKNVKYINACNRKSLRVLLILYRARVVICCNRFWGVDRPDQFSVYLCHGIPLKDVSSYYNVSSSIKYVIGTSEYLINLFSEQFHVNRNRIMPLGFPRNDVLLEMRKPLCNVFGSFDNYIVWYPTVKTFNSGERTGSVKPIQFVWNKEQASLINEQASRNNQLIIIKPHFAQLSTEIRKFQFSNIKFIDDSFLVDNKITSYELIGSSDALLTDYSSVYFDYLLCNRPIGLIWEDITEYMTNPGLISNYKELCKGAKKIYTINQLCDFLDDVKNGRDLLKEERQNLVSNIFCSNKPDNSARVVDFIVKTSKMKY